MPKPICQMLTCLSVTDMAQYMQFAKLLGTYAAITVMKHSLVG